MLNQYKSSQETSEKMTKNRLSLSFSETDRLSSSQQSYSWQGRKLAYRYEIGIKEDMALTFSLSITCISQKTSTLCTTTQGYCICHTKLEIPSLCTPHNFGVLILFCRRCPVQCKVLKNRSSSR